MELNSKLCLSLHGELYVVDLSDIMCFEADDHYTHVFTSRGNSFMGSPEKVCGLSIQSC